MKQDRQKLFTMLGYLKNSPTQLREIASHLDDYFKHYADDEEFLNAVRPALTMLFKLRK